MVEGQISQPPSRTRLALFLGGAILVASAITFLFVLPAEFHRDPTGFGRMTGLDRLAGPQLVQAAAPTGANTAARYYGTAYREDTIAIPVEAGDGELEYKVHMKEGDTLVYSWTVTGSDDPELFYFDFHSESRPNPPGAPAKVTEFLQKTGTRSSGALIAPFEGVHGWYLQNQSDKPVVVHLKLAGFYTLIPPGEYGNEARISPNPL